MTERADTTPVFCQIKLIVADLAASLRFYRLIGLQFQEHGAHADAALAAGITLELDTDELASTWDPGWRRRPGTATLVGFAVDDDESVDRIFARMVERGYRAHLAPHHAPWGRRLAIVDDPDGNPVAITGPRTNTLQHSRSAPAEEPRR